MPEMRDRRKSVAFALLTFWNTLFNNANKN
jgi:hypothetical protein